MQNWRAKLGKLRNTECETADYLNDQTAD